MDSKERANFRKTKAWHELREQKRQEQKVDYLTQKKLTKTFNLHHLDLNPDNYSDISNSEHFIGLNKKSHDCIHFLYSYYSKDPEVLDRLKSLLDLMKEINRG